MGTREQIFGLPDITSDPPGTTKLLRLRVIAGIRLAKKDIFGASDPYVKIVLFRGCRDSGVIDTVTTKTIKKSLNPKWNEEFIFRVNSRDNKLLLEVFDENRVTRDDFLGLVEIPLEHADIQAEEHDSLLPAKDFILRPRSLRSRVRGHLRLYLAYLRDDAINEVDDSPATEDLATEIEESGWEVLDNEEYEGLPESIEEPSEDNPDGTRTPTHSNQQSPSQSNRSTPTHSRPQAAGNDLPRGWEERIDSQGRTFFVNHNTRTTQWERPSNLGDLPSNWEERVDNNGRTYYIDHNTRCTTWIRPSETSEVEEDRRRRDAATVFRSRHHISQEDTLTNDQSNSRTNSVSESIEDIAGAMGRMEVPAQRRDSDSGYGSRSNIGAGDEEDPIPPGWTVSVAPNGRIFYINHNTKQTTWDDPRRSRSKSIPTHPSAPRASRSTSNQPHEDRTLGLGPLQNGWEERIHTDGRTFYINHERKITQWEDPRLEKLSGPALQYSIKYKQKYHNFRSKIKKPQNVPNKFDIKIRRSNIFEDSYRCIMGVNRCDLLKTRLWIEFDSEQGLDYGGVSREWFYLLSKEMFNPYYGLFEYSAIDDYTLQINALSGFANEEHLSYFQFIGRVAGMAVYHGKLIDAYFIRPFYKMMLNRPITLDDMESVDPEYHNSLKWILENDPECLELTFSVDEDVFGVTELKELKRNGRDIAVTERNKAEYIDLVIKWRFVSRIEKQMTMFMKGFNELCPRNLLAMFDANEVELLLAGLQDVDVQDWKKNTSYRGDYNENYPTIGHFWRAVYSFNNETRSRLLQFVTGTSRVPMNGFAELYGSNGPQLFTIEKWGNASQLPRAHTCFNRIDLPPYESYQELRTKLLTAIENTEGFEGVD